jgi:hypothetical protein
MRRGRLSLIRRRRENEFFEFLLMKWGEGMAGGREIESDFLRCVDSNP